MVSTAGYGSGRRRGRAACRRWRFTAIIPGLAGSAVFLGGAGAQLPDGISVPEGFESICCEVYGPGGAALIVECRTDNRERTIAQLREVVREHGGYLGARGSVSYLFNEVGQLKFPAGTDTAQVAAVALEAGAEDVIPAPLEVLTDPVELATVRAALQSAGWIPASAAVTRRASITIPLTGEAAVQMLHLVEALKALKDVENVYTNVEIPDEVLAYL
jgi:transcriptional/translational regulatory protein YebC/TACO1